MRVGTKGRIKGLPLGFKSVAGIDLAGGVYGLNNVLNGQVFGKQLVIAVFKLAHLGSLGYWPRRLFSPGFPRWCLPRHMLRCDRVRWCSLTVVFHLAGKEGLFVRSRLISLGPSIPIKNTVERGP